jgi:hypothetical protein
LQDESKLIGAFHYRQQGLFAPWLFFGIIIKDYCPINIKLKNKMGSQLWMAVLTGK